MTAVAPVAPPDLGTPPTSGDPANFDARADSFLPNLTPWGAAIKAIGDASYSNALESQTQAGNAANSAVVAGQQAAQAALSVAAAQAVSGATRWVSGTYYAQDVVVISPANGQNYRRRAAGAGATDPSADPANWFPLLLLQSLPTQEIAVNTPASAGIHYIFTASCTLTLPANPTVGDLIGINNESGTLTCQIDPNGKKVRGYTGIIVVNSFMAAALLKYSGANFGWIKQ